MADARAGLILDAVDRTAQAFSSVDRRVRALNQVATFATRAIGGLSAAVGAREFIKAADTYRLLSNRLKLVTDSAEELADVQSRLFDLAQDTRQSYESTVELYARIARSSDELGLSQTRLIGLTQAINQAIQVSGATAEEASAGVIQFAQGLASGALRGDELRSVLEQMPRLAQAIAAGMGVTVGQLRELGSEGQLSATTVIRAIESQSAALQAEFEQTEGTVGQAITRLNNSMLTLVGRINEASGASSGLARALNFVADAMTGPDLTAQGLDEATIRIAAAQHEVMLLRREHRAAVAEFERDFEGDAYDRMLAAAEAVRAKEAELEAQVRRRRDAQTADLSEISFTARGRVDEPVGPPKPTAGEMAAAAGLQQQREQAAAALEEVRQHLLTREEVEREAIFRRLEIVRTAYEQELIDQARYAALSAEVAREGQQRLTQIAVEGMTARDRFEAMSAKQKTEHVLGGLTQMTAGVAQHNKTLFNLNKGLALAQASAALPAAVIESFKNAGGYPWGIPMAAAMAAAGAAQIAAIRATTFQGGGAGTTPSLAGSAGTINSVPREQQTIPALPERSEARAAPHVELHIQGNVIGTNKEDLAAELTRLLREHIDLTDDRL